MQADILDVDEQGFAAEVIEESRRRPVVVDFWAPWCGPCRALGPVLERVCQQAQGGFRLAKVNTDDNPGISQAHNIRGIPAVFAYRGGEPVDTFTGALPEPQVRAFIDKLVPKKSAPDVDRALAALAQGQLDQARAAIDQALAQDPNDPRAQLAQGQILCAEGNAAGAKAVHAALSPEGPVTSQDIDRLGARIALIETSQQAGALGQGAQAALQGRLADAFEAARAAMTGGDKAHGHELAKAVINLCEDDDQVRDMRRSLAMLLF